MEQSVAKTSRSTRPKRKELRVYRAWCKRCGICVSFCPKEALEKDDKGYPRWKNREACVVCGLCELRCPDFAIEVLGEGGKADDPT